VAVAFKLVSSEAGSTLQCKLDKAAFAARRSPFKKRLRRGSHSFRVRAVDAAGNVDPSPARRLVSVVRKRR
jgi:large repetitive protein